MLEFTDRWIFNTKDPYDFVEKCGGIRTIDQARRLAQAAEGTIDDTAISFHYQEVIPKRD
jgi:hypothetical protein